MNCNSLEVLRFNLGPDHTKTDRLKSHTSYLRQREFGVLCIPLRFTHPYATTIYIYSILASKHAHKPKRRYDFAAF